MARQISIAIKTNAKSGFGPWSHDKNKYKCVDIGKWQSECTGSIWIDDCIDLPGAYEGLCKRYEMLIGTRWRVVDVQKDSRLSDDVVFEKIEE